MKDAFFLFTGYIFSVPKIHYRFIYIFYEFSIIIIYDLLGDAMSKKKLLKVNKESGGRLKKVREQKKLTQEEFADELGISVSAYKKLESGENGISTKRLRKLKTMNISSDYILYGEQTSIERLRVDVDNSSEPEKMEILLKLIMEFSRDKVKGGGMTKDQMTELISCIYDKDKV